MSENLMGFEGCDYEEARRILGLQERRLTGNDSDACSVIARAIYHPLPARIEAALRMIRYEAISPRVARADMELELHLSIASRDERVAALRAKWEQVPVTERGSDALSYPFVANASK